MAQTKPPHKQPNYKQMRMQEARQQAKTRRLLWITSALVIVIFIAVVAVLSKPKPYEFAYSGLPVLGDPNAPVKIVEFGDYKCPSCQYFSQQIEPKLKADFIDKGLVSLYFMNFTIIGPDSVTAALAGQSVYHQSNDAFWKFYDTVYKNQGDEKTAWATPQALTDLARKANLNIDYDKLLSDINAKTYKNEVDEHQAAALKLRLNSTPSVFINGKLFNSGLDYDKLKAEIEKALPSK